MLLVGEGSSSRVHFFMLGGSRGDDVGEVWDEFSVEIHKSGEGL